MYYSFHSFRYLDMILAALKKDHEKYHLTCDDDLTRHRGEIFLVDRTTVQTPLKILDIPIYKFWYGKLNKINSQLS